MERKEVSLLQSLWEKIKKAGKRKDQTADYSQNPSAAMPPYRYRAIQHHPTAHEKQHRAAEQSYWQEQLRLAQELNVLTKGLNWITVGATVVGLLGLVGLYFTFDEAREANRIDRESVRALLVPDPQEKDPTVPVVSFLPGKDGFEIRLRNVGQTRVRAYLVEGWMLLEDEIALLGDHSASDIQRRSIAPNSATIFTLKTQRISHDIQHAQHEKRPGKLIGLLWRIKFQDIFFEWDCEEFAFYSKSLPEMWGAEGKLVTTDAPGVCDRERKMRSIRFRRICIPDSRPPGWEGMWEALLDANPLPIPEDDPTRCRGE